MYRTKQKVKKNFICIIPARSKSKGIKNKNIRILGGRPLIYWTIKEALKCKYFSKVIVSTDSLKIKKFLKNMEQNVLLRPKKLSGDRTPSAMVIQHAIKQLNNKNKKVFSIYCFITTNITFKEGTRLGQKYKDF